MEARGNYCFSENDNYAIQRTGQARVLYVRSGAAAPATVDFFELKDPAVTIDLVSGKPAKARTSGENRTLREYLRYAPKAKFEDNRTRTRYPEYEGPGQCVQYACGLLQDDKGWGEKHPDTGRFHGGRALDLTAGGDARRGALTEAAPNASTAVAGDIMFLTRRVPPVPGGPMMNGYNFHGAFVVAVDGVDQITSEACVDAGRWQANFYMYSNTPGGGASFLDKFENQMDGHGLPGAIVSARVVR